MSPYFSPLKSILILSHLRLGFPSGLLPSGFPTKTLYVPLLSPIRATCLAHFNRSGCPAGSVLIRGSCNRFLTELSSYGEELLAPRPTPSWRTTPCRLPATAYSTCSQLPFISGGSFSSRNLRTRNAVVTGTHF